MDRETFHNCCSLAKMPRQIHQQHCSSHFIEFTEDWNCRKNWVTIDGKPNLQRLLHEFDETPVPVANCSAKEYNSNPKQIMPFKEFIQYWREYIQNGHSSPKGCLYLKDWHMQSGRCCSRCRCRCRWRCRRTCRYEMPMPRPLEMPLKRQLPKKSLAAGDAAGSAAARCRCRILRQSLLENRIRKRAQSWAHSSRRNFPEHNTYKNPIYFSSDWLNEYWDTTEVDDYRFVYMGPKGSWTPFHADVFRSYSWSANICGRKKWLLYPPGQEEFLRDCHGNLAYDVTALILQDKGLYAQFEEACQPLEIIQEAGEIIFVPSGWHHQVYNLEDTISINHNWLNGCNLDTMWQFLQDELSSVQREIEEWRDTMDTWHQHCQVIMKSCTGIDYGEFASFLKTIANIRISFLNSCPRNADNCQDLLAESLCALGPHHAAFDLQRVLHIFENMLSNEDFKRLDPSALSFKPEELLQEIREAVRTIV
ncbi:2-oxoglutarate and iron-dependent oxygenase JMJD4 isoform X2 [Chanodichthys erythropterus]|uniref:2-oxoglutarate and iron-dependent oxygenase JMJD4 isoform X2 n=1 Tax=Chanodichthys erythropterus TaxID=933992 RepID=UPI00351F0506